LWSQGRDFVPITNAHVYTLEGQFLYDAPVALLNRQQIVMMLERDAL